MRTEIKSLVEKIKDYELKYNSDKSKVIKKELEFFIDELFREVDYENAEENTYILQNILSITNKLYKGVISTKLLESPQMKVSKSIWGILLENNLIKRSNIKQLDYSINPKNKELNKIFQEIVYSEDSLRPVMTGLLFEGDFVIGTDAHKLIHLKGKRVGSFKDGIYKLYSQVEKEYLKTDGSISFDEYFNKNAIIDGKYPNYVVITPKSYQYTKQFDLKILNDILVTIYKNNLANPITNNVIFEFNTKDGKYNISFNSKLLSDVCESLLMAGENIVNFYFNEPSQAVVILSEKDNFPDKYEADYFFQKNTFSIIMPTRIVYDDESYLKHYPLIKYNDMYDFDITIGDSPTYNLISGDKKTESKKSKSDIYKDLIEGYELALEMESNKNKIKLFQDIIEGYKLALELA